jgi:hypothetical protein
VLVENNAFNLVIAVIRRFATPGKKLLLFQALVVVVGIKSVKMTPLQPSAPVLNHHGILSHVLLLREPHVGMGKKLDKNIHVIKYKDVWCLLKNNLVPFLAQLLVLVLGVIVLHVHQLAKAALAKGDTQSQHQQLTVENLATIPMVLTVLQSHALDFLLAQRLVLLR